MHTFFTKLLIVFALVLGLQASVAAKFLLTGSGSTAITPFMFVWSRNYYQYTKGENSVVYNSIGSGGGQSNLFDKVVNFATSDQPLSKKTLQKYHIVQFPLNVSAIAIVYHIKSLKKPLILTPKLIAEIFMGKIKYWDNQKIIKYNKNNGLPHKPIIIIHRADGSGTTYNFTYYLSSIYTPWKQQIGFGKIVNWSNASYGAKGNEGITSQVKNINDTIGYADYSYAVLSNISMAKLKTREGIITLTQHSMKQTATSLQWNTLLKQQFTVLPKNFHGKNIWPIMMMTYALIRNDEPKKQDVFDFINWSMTTQGGVLTKLHYEAIPVDVWKRKFIPYIVRYIHTKKMTKHTIH